MNIKTFVVNNLFMRIGIYEYSVKQSIEKLNCFLKENKTQEIVFFCAGNYKIWYDSFSSAVADGLKHENIKCFVYGGKGFSILATNILSYMGFIEKKHPQAKIIIIDNCKTCFSAESGCLVSKQMSTIPAGLINSKSFGHYSLLLKVCLTEDSEKFLEKQKFVVNEILQKIAI